MRKTPRLLWIISFHHACNDGTLMALIALIPILVEEMDLSYKDVGLLGFGLLITVVVQYLVGRIADRSFSRYLLEVGAVLMGSSFILLLFVSDFTGLFLAVIAMRIGAAFYHPVGISWITRECAGEHLETALGVQSGVGNFGVIVALATSGFLGEVFDWKVPCMIWAGLNFAAVLAGLLLIEERAVRARPLQQTTGIAPLRTFRKMAPLVIPIVTGGALYQVTSYFGPINLTQTADWTAGRADLMFAVWIGVGTLTSYYYGLMSHRFGRQRLLAAGYLVSAASVLALALSTQWFLIGPVLVIYGALLFMTYPALFSFLASVTEEGERGTAFGILFGFQLGGGAVMVYLCGVIADLTDDPSTAYLVALALALASVLSLASKGRASSSAKPDG